MIKSETFVLYRNAEVNAHIGFDSNLCDMQCEQEWDVALMQNLEEKVLWRKYEHVRGEILFLASAQKADFREDVKNKLTLADDVT